MNKRSLGWRHPAVIYLILLILVSVVSWIGSIMEIGRGAGNEELALRSVLGVPGLRWAVRTAASCLGNAPVGNALMLFMAIGAGRGSGLFRALSRLRNLSPKESTAFYISLVVLAIVIFLIILGVYAGSHLLLGITGTLKGSPLYDGFMFLVMLGIGLPSLVYGLQPRLSALLRTASMLSAPYCLRSHISWSLCLWRLSCCRLWSIPILMYFWAYRIMLCVSFRSWFIGCRCL